MSLGDVVAGRRRRGDPQLGLDHDEGTRRRHRFKLTAYNLVLTLQLATPVTSRLGGVFKTQVGRW